MLSTFTNRSSDLADLPIIFRPGTDLAMLNYIANHIITTGRVNQEFVRGHTTFMRAQTDIGYGLRPDDPREKRAEGCGRSRRHDADGLRRLRSVREGLHAGEGVAAFRRGTRSVARAGGTLRRSEAQGRVAVDDGLQPACPRRMGEPALLQSASADRQDRRTGQRSVLADRPALGLRHRARGRHIRASSARRHGRDQSRASQTCRGGLAGSAGADPRQARLSRRAAGPDAEGRQAQLVLDADHQQRAGGAEQPGTRPGPATAIPTTSSLSPTPIRPSPRWRPI